MLAMLSIVKGKLRGRSGISTPHLELGFDKGGLEDSHENIIQ
jgi:hypothetical protein